MAQGNNPDALRNFEKSTSLDTSLTKAHFCCGLTYSLMGSMELAVKEWEHMLDEDGDFFVGGCPEADQGKVAMVVDLWSVFCSPGSGIIAHYHSGIAFLALVHISEALADFDDVYFANPGLERIAYYRSVALNKLARYKEAADVCEKALDGRSRDPLLCYQCGVAMLESARSAKGVAMLQKAIEYNPRYLKAHLRLAQVYFEMAQYDAAVELLRKVVDFCPKSAEAHFELGRCYEKQFKMEEAGEAYLAAVKLRTDYKEAQLQLAIVMRNLGRQEEALAHLKEYVRLDADDSDGYYLMGTVLAALGRDSEAVAAFEDAVDRNPRHLYAYYSLGMSCAKCNLYVRAVAAFEAALAINPRELKARVALGKLHFANNELVRAVKEFEQVLAANPNDCESRYYLGGTLLKLGNLEKAQTELQQAVRVAGGGVTPGSALEHMFYGYLSAQGSDCEKCVGEYQKGCEFVPSSDSEISMFSIMLLLGISGAEKARKSQTMRNYAENVEDSLFKFVEAIARLLDTRDPVCTCHSERVGIIAGAIAKHLELGRGMENVIHIGAYLHDIGKVGLPDACFDAYGVNNEISEDDYAIYRQHPALGKEQLESILFPEGVLAIIRSHHEFWDGSGYPDGLRGENIPMVAQIVGIADCYDRLITREYAGGRMAPNVAMAQIKCASDKWFHAGLVEALDSVLDELGLLLSDHM